MGCDSKKKEELGEEKGCAQVIPDGLSGYCECVGGRRAMEVTCKHEPFTCRAACSGADEPTKRGSTSCTLDGKGCTAKEKMYIKKFYNKPEADITKQIVRLSKMAGEKMAEDKLQWVRKRITILLQLRYSLTCTQ
jgi:hypothetical protein